MGAFGDRFQPCCDRFRPCSVATGLDRHRGDGLGTRLAPRRRSTAPPYNGQVLEVSASFGPRPVPSHKCLRRPWPKPAASVCRRRALPLPTRRPRLRASMIPVAGWRKSRKERTQSHNTDMTAWTGGYASSSPTGTECGCRWHQGSGKRPMGNVHAVPNGPWAIDKRFQRAFRRPHQGIILGDPDSSNE